MKQTYFRGVMPALVTPLDERENLSVEGLEKLMEHLIAEGASGFYIGGATGEAFALSRETREALAVESVRVAKGRVPCIVHIAATDFRETVALAKQAERAGADAISALPPLFFQYDADDVYQYYKKIANAVSLPLMVYYNPAAGFPIDASFAARLFTIDNVTAIKWTSPRYDQMVRLKELTHGEMNVINGPDEMLLMGLSAGADGGIGTTYNVFLPIVRKIYDCFVAGDMAGAQAAQTKETALVDALCSYRLIPAVKALLEVGGYPVGNASFPMKRYTDAEKKEIFARLSSLGMPL